MKSEPQNYFTDTMNAPSLTDMTVEDLLAKLVSFPSLSTREAELVNWLEDQLKETGLVEVERVDDNLLIHAGSGKPWLLLNSHSDVVPPSPDHQGEPFDPVIRDGRMYGRGTTDAKASSAGMIKAMLNYAANPSASQGRVTFAMTVCEEAYGDQNGMARLRKFWGDQKPDAAIVGEPTLLAPCIAQKGLVVLRLITRGQSGHAARVYGENAIYKMGIALNQLSSINYNNENPYLGPVKITPTTITGGSANNANPEYCEVEVDIRTIPDIPVSQLIHDLNKTVDAEVVIKSDRLISTGTDPDSAIAKAAYSATGKDFFGSPTCSDWVFLSDVPTVKLGPGDSNDSHTKNESIDLQQAKEAENVYGTIIRNYFSELS